MKLIRSKMLCYTWVLQELVLDFTTYFNPVHWERFQKEMANAQNALQVCFSRFTVSKTYDVWLTL